MACCQTSGISISELCFTLLLLSTHPRLFSAHRHAAFVEAFVHRPASHYPRNSKQFVPRTVHKAGFWDGLSDLWDEVVEVSTYGPSERKLLKKQREQQKQLQQQTQERIRPEEQESTSYVLDENGDSEAWMNAFAAEKKKRAPIEESTPPIDGYELRDLLVEKWGVPLDIDFQRSTFQVDVLYCAIVPVVGYGDRKGRSRALPARHDSELDYLCHLQGVIEVLHQYDQLEAFLAMIDTTNKVPKRGTESVLFHMKLSPEDLKRVLNL